MTQSRKWLLGGIGAAVLLFLVGFFLVVNPARNQAAELQDEVLAMNESNIRLAAKLEQMKQQSAEVPAKIAQIEEVKKMMPTEMKQPELVRAIEQEAQSAGVDLTGITPAAPVQQEGSTVPIIVLPMDITATGRYANIKTFVDNLERQERAFLINTVEVANSETDVFTLTLNGDFFSLPEGTLDTPETAADRSPGTAATSPEPVPQAAAAAQRPQGDAENQAKKSASKKADKAKSSKHAKSDKRAHDKKHAKAKAEKNSR